jgi:ribosome-associated heat shock protein Hsp15
MVTEACKKSCNGKWQCKTIKRSFPTDKITFRKDQITQIITVLDIPDNRVSAKLVDIYRRNDTPAEAYQHLELLKLSKEHYRKKWYRPTYKRHRRIW